MVSIINSQVFLIFGLNNPFTPVGFARGIAKAQLKSLHLVKKRYPDCESEEQYALAISMRPGISLEKAYEIVENAKFSNFEILKDEAEELKFNMVVIELVSDEYERRTHHFSNNVIHDLINGVQDIIPLNL